MKLTRRKLRKLIQENLEKRIKMADDIERLGIKTLPDMGATFLADPKARYTASWDPVENYLALDAGGLERYRRGIKIGSQVKKLFAKYADKNFMDSLILAHYSTMTGIAGILRMSNRDELSCSAYIPEDFTPTSHRAGVGRYGTTGMGVVLSGHVSYMTNNQDTAATGAGNVVRKAFEPHPGHFYWKERYGDEDFEDRMELRGKEERPFAGTNRSVSSGVNKAPFIVPSTATNSLMRTLPDAGEKRHGDAYYGSRTIKGGAPPVVLDREDYLPRRDFNTYIANEALVDNWKVLAVIYNPEGDNERVYYPDDYTSGYPEEGPSVFDTLRKIGYNGPILTYQQAEKYKASLVNNYYFGK
jgi:hypothetical protein